MALAFVSLDHPKPAQMFVVFYYLNWSVLDKVLIQYSGATDAFQKPWCVVYVSLLYLGFEQNSMETTLLTINLFEPQTQTSLIDFDMSRIKQPVILNTNSNLLIQKRLKRRRRRSVTSTK